MIPLQLNNGTSVKWMSILGFENTKDVMVNSGDEVKARETPGICILEIQMKDQRLMRRKLMLVP